MPPMGLPSGHKLGPYEILAPLGAGGMGEVYRARDTRLNRDVALKVLPAAFANDADRMARFQREAQVLAALNHPNIAAIHGLEGNALVMEYVPGENLAGPLPVDEALALARQITEALEYAHDKGIIHRDLKPANIKITPDGKVKVLDFGLAKALTEERDETSYANSPTLSAMATKMGVILGTAAYMSPEQARGKTVDRRTDIWAFGAVLYEMLTGKQAFPGETASDAMAAILAKEPEWAALPPGSPVKLLRKCLEKDPAKRLRHIGDAWHIEEAAAAPVAAAPSRPWVWMAAAALLAIGAGALAAIHFREKPPEAPQVTRFSIGSPEKTTLNIAPEVSPDGRSVALVSIGQDGNSLWVRPLDSLEPRSIARVATGGTSISEFFWSPDSRMIAFRAFDKLKKVEVAGGPPQTICDTTTRLRGGSWNRDGIIIQGQADGPLLRVAAAGGVAAPLTALDSSRNERGHYYPKFLPDGRHFLFLATSSQPENNAVYLSSLESPKDRKRILASAQAAVYAPPQKEGPGLLLFLRESTLMAQPFDEKRFELLGEAFPVAEQVGSSAVHGYFSVSTNGVLAYRGGSSRLLQLAWFDRTGKLLQTVGAPGIYNDLALSSDDQRVAVSRAESQGGFPDLWLIDLAHNGNPSRFTFDPAQDWMPVWSPDGARIAFSSPRDGPDSLYQKPASGAGSEELLLKSPGNRMYANDWSRDGRYLLYSSVDPVRNSDLWVLPLSPDIKPGDRKPEPFLQTQFNEGQGQFSPDGKFVAYRSNVSGQDEIYVQTFPVSGAQWMISSGGGTQPRWRRDGKEIFYIAGNKLMAAEVKTAPKFEHAVAKSLFETRIFFGLAVNVFRYAPSADGQRFLINTVPEEAAAVAPITVVLNWTAGLKH